MDVAAYQRCLRDYLSLWAAGMFYQEGDLSGLCLAARRYEDDLLVGRHGSHLPVELLEQVPSECAGLVSADRWLHGEGVAGSQRRLALQGVAVSYQAIENSVRR